MAYRTYVGTTEQDPIQILGNNEYYYPFIEELKKQGCRVDEDLCYDCAEIKDIQSIIEILEQYIWEKDEEVKIYKHDIFNLRPNEKDIIKDFTFKMQELQENGYIFVTANLINYLKDNLDKEYDMGKNRYIYTIKDGKKVW